MEWTIENAKDYVEGYDEGYAGEPSGFCCSKAYYTGHDKGRIQRNKETYGSHVPTGGVIG